MTPRQIVAGLVRYIRTQADAQRAVARAALEIAGDLCIYTNRNIEVEEL